MGRIGAPHAPLSIGISCWCCLIDQGVVFTGCEARPLQCSGSHLSPRRRKTATHTVCRQPAIRWMTRYPFLKIIVLGNSLATRPEANDRKSNEKGDRRIGAVMTQSAAFR